MEPPLKSTPDNKHRFGVASGTIHRSRLPRRVELPLAIFALATSVAAMVLVLLGYL